MRPSDCKEIKPVSREYSLEGLLLKLKLQYFGHLMQRLNTVEKNLMVGKTKDIEVQQTTPGGIRAQSISQHQTGTNNRDERDGERRTAG